MDDKYHTFIQFLFNRVESRGDWRFELDDEEPELTGEEVVDYVWRMFENYQTDLAHFSDWQLGAGLEYIFNNTFSDLPFFLRDGPAPLEERIKAIKALKNLYSKCLNERCMQTLGHYSEEGNQLNHFCYVLWDTCPLTYCEEMKDKEKIYAAVAEVMEFSLSLDNIACVESGLHGLGHLKPYYSNAVKIIKRYLETTGQSDERLLEYAKHAETGCIL